MSEEQGYDQTVQSEDMGEEMKEQGGGGDPNGTSENEDER